MIAAFVRLLPPCFACRERSTGTRSTLRVGLDKGTRREVVAMFPLFYAAITAGEATR